MAYNSYNTPKTIHDNDDGDSQIYVGIKYLGIVAQQINEVRIAQKMALHSTEFIRLWLNELIVFYDLVENRTGIQHSKEIIKAYDYTFNSQNNSLDKVEIEIEERNKYPFWFKEIEEMIERNEVVVDIQGANKFKSAKYINYKKIKEELSRCYRELMRDANKRHLIMPEGIKDMKQQIKEEWLDRDIKKEFF